MSRLYHRRRQLVALLLAWCACASAIDGLVSAAAAAASEERVRNPWFCHDYDCPGYTVLRTLDDLELRSYSQGIWVSTNTSGGFDAAVRLGFLKLFEYISGGNEHGWRIDMTAPVRTQVTPAGSSCDDHFTVSFYLPDEYQDGHQTPPAPNRDAVWIDTTPPESYWVAQYAGFTSQTKVLEKARSIMNRLDDAGEPFVSGRVFSSSYDPPYRLFNRHNEVWVPAAASSDGAVVASSAAGQRRAAGGSGAAAASA